jgi:anti-sigma factor RsiW
MVCELWKTRLDTYLDGELASQEMRDFDSHVHSCPTCGADALARVQMKRSIQAVGKRFAPNPGFRKRVQRRIEAKPRRGAFGVAWITAAAVTAVLVVGGLATTYRARDRARTEQVFGEVADLHVGMLASSAPVDVVSTDRHTVKPWFQGKIPFAFDLPELQNSEFSLLGGRMTYLAQTPGAHLVYEVRKHRISVFVFREGALRFKFDENAPARKELSFNVETWSQGGLCYFVIGDASAIDVHNLADLLKSAAT